MNRTFLPNFEYVQFLVVLAFIFRGIKCVLYYVVSGYCILG